MKRVWAAWKRAARRVGDWQARLLLAAFYYTVFAPFALLAHSRAGSRRGWQRQPEPEGNALDRARRQ